MQILVSVLNIFFTRSASTLCVAPHHARYGTLRQSWHTADIDSAAMAPGTEDAIAGCPSLSAHVVYASQLPWRSMRGSQLSYAS